MKKYRDIAVCLTTKSSLSALILFFIYLVFSMVIPPLQSPDEFDHVKRAYFLADGMFVLDSPEGKSSGGMIDIGLISYINSYTVLMGKPERKLSADELTEANSIRWVGQKVFSSAPGTGYYMPIVYLPQAVGLKLGELFGLSVDVSYRLARFAVLVAATLLIFASFRIYSPSPLVLALLIVPMSLFQMSSTSLDVMSTALAIAVVSLFLQLVNNRECINNRLLLGLAVCVFLLVSCKINLLPLLSLLFFLGIYARNKTALIAGVLVVVGVLAWLFVALKSTVDLRIATGFTTSGIVAFYLKHPLSFFHVLINTLPSYGLGYAHSFMGVLGWFDTRMSNEVYSRLYILLFCVLMFSIGIVRKLNSARALLALCAFVSALLVFFALLVTWNIHPASTIQGVQGRYFLIPALLLAYSLGGGERKEYPLYSIVGAIALITFFVFSSYSTTITLVERYYMASNQPTSIKTQLQVSPQLTPEASIKLGFSEKYRADPVPLKRLGVIFGTYGKKNLGEAELRLTTADGEVFAQRFDLSDLGDNQYRYFDVEPKPYVQGEILASSGGGVSVWEGRAESEVHSCLVYEYADGRKNQSVGCPVPNQ